VPLVTGAAAATAWVELIVLAGAVDAFGRDWTRLMTTVFTIRRAGFV
jgi:hypothetical protein